LRNTPPPTRECPIITRVDIAWVCVATDDPSPLHLDDAYAHEAGHPSVIVPGTLLLGWVGQFLEDWAGDPGNVESWDIRFQSPIWPGEQVTLVGELLEGANGADDTVGVVRATTRDGREVGLANVRFCASRSEGRVAP